MALGNLIKSWENIMRDDDGVNGTVQVLSQLVWMLFLKVYDLREDMWEFREDDFKSAIPENCRWRNWAKGKSQKEQMTGDTLVDFVDNTLFPTLKKLSVTAESSKRKIIVRDMMAESYNYMKDGVCIRKAVNLLDSIDFENQEELHAFNVIYETLLRGLQSAGRSGEFYTPRAITKFITEKVNPELGKITADFACGTGGFLIDAVEHLRKQIKRAEDNAVIENTVFGIEKKQFPYMLCATNMLLHDVDYPRISHANSLAKNVREYKDSEKVDFVLMNPPYGGHEQEGIQVNFPSKLRSSETANLFMIEILYRLKNNGRCGVVLPDGFLQNDDASLIAIKKKLFDECDVHTIIRLPSSCFAPYTSIATNLLFFDKRGGTKETWFYRFDLPSGQKFSMKKNPITREKLGDIDKWWDNRVEIKDEKEDESLTTTYKAKCVSIDEIAEGNYNLDFCGFPNEEKIILSPEETLANYESQRTYLEKNLSLATSALKNFLAYKPANLKNIYKLSNQLSKLNTDFPQNMKAAILQAAMQGKLTEQLETDSSVDELLEEIKREREELIKKGELKNQKELAPVSAKEIPFDIPDNWKWVRLGEVFSIVMGSSPEGKNISIDKTGMEFHQGKVFFGKNYLKISDQFTTEITKIAEKNSVLLCVRAPVGVVNITERKICIGRGLCAISSYGLMSSQFILYFLQALKNDFIKKSTGSTFKAISNKIVNNQIFPLPPLEEQQRIVEKLDALLPLCEELGE